MKGDEVVEAGEEGTNLALLLQQTRHREHGIEEVVGRDIEQPVVPRALCRDELDATMPTVRLVIGHKPVRVGT